VVVISGGGVGGDGEFVLDWGEVAEAASAPAAVRSAELFYI
jgi:hypothetical protein